MKFFSVQSLDELKEYGNRYTIKKEISDNLGDNIKFIANSWENLYKVIVTLNNISNLVNSQQNNRITKIFNCKSESELKQIGKLNTLKNEINDFCNQSIIIKTNSWEKFYIAIDNIKKICNLNNAVEQVEICDDLYFKGIAEKYIFFLLELDGKQRLDKLCVNRLHYAKKEIANKWRNDIAKIIHPDICHHPNAEKAMSELNDMYKEMIE